MQSNYNFLLSRKHAIRDFMGILSNTHTKLSLSFNDNESDDRENREKQNQKVTTVTQFCVVTVNNNKKGRQMHSTIGNKTATR